MAPGTQDRTLSLHSQLGEGKSLPSGTPDTSLSAPPNKNDPLHSESLKPLDPVYQHRPAKETSTRRRLPKPIEPIHSTCRRDKSGLGPFSHEDSSATGLRPRRFAPQLLETASRSVRKSTPPARCNNSQPNITCGLTPVQEHVPQPQFSDESRLCRQKRRRRHSFRIPDLPTIPSSCSGDSSDSELPSLSPSASSNGLEKQPKPEDQRRESCDEHISQYLLSLAARSAKDQLKDRTLANFPNEQIHQPIDHFAINTEDDAHLSDKGPVEKEHSATCRRTSSGDLSWELEYIRHHREEAEVRSQAMLDSPTPAMAAREILNTATEIQAGEDGDEQYDGVLGARATSPPLLGDDLIFPRSLSPQGTRHINGNITSQHRGYFDQLYQPPEGLWCANLHVVRSGGDGLWMGTCRKDGERDEKSLFQGPITSADEHQDIPTYADELVSYEDASPLSYGSMNSRNFDDASRSFMAQDDLEKGIDDGFVTQIYNYLSLGYPCVACHYDLELSEISSMPVKELQQDDLRTDDKGYVGIIEGTAGNTEPTGCISMRWMALRLYIQEWVKRQPRIASNLGASGVCERRGSWAG